MRGLCGVYPVERIVLAFCFAEKNGKKKQVYCIHFLLVEDMRQFTGGINWNTASGVDSMSAFLARDVRVWASRSPKTHSGHLRRRRAASKPPEGFTRTRLRVTMRRVDRAQLVGRSVRARSGRARRAPKVEALVDGSHPCWMQPTRTAPWCRSSNDVAQWEPQSLGAAPRRLCRT